MIPTTITPAEPHSLNLSFQNPEGWGCDSHGFTAEMEEISRAAVFQNPEGWGCDSHAALVWEHASARLVSESRRMGV